LLLVLIGGVFRNRAACFAW